MSSILQSIKSGDNPPEIHITVTPSETPVSSSIEAGIFMWPNLYTGNETVRSGEPSYSSPVITPYRGDYPRSEHAGGQLIRPESKHHYTDTLLTFSGTVHNLGEGLSVDTYSWDFGDGSEASGESITHEYKIANPSLEVHLTITLNNGEEFSAGQVLSLIRTVTSHYKNYVPNPNFDHNVINIKPHLWESGTLDYFQKTGSTLLTTSGWSVSAPQSMLIKTTGKEQGAYTELSEISSGKYRGSATVKAKSGSFNAQMIGGHESSAHVKDFTITTSGQECSIYFEVNETPAYLSISSISESDQEFYVDNVIVTASGDEIYYFDGDTRYSGWNGLPGASASWTMYINENEVEFTS